jgi:hypothetical protein
MTTQENIRTLEDFIEVCQAKQDNNRRKAIIYLTERNIDTIEYDKVLTKISENLFIEGSAYFLAKVTKSNDALNKIKEMYK